MIRTGLIAVLFSVLVPLSAAAAPADDAHRLAPWLEVPATWSRKVESSLVVVVPNDLPRLLLRADGSYEDRGGFLRVIGSPWNLVVPDGDAMVSR